MNIRRFFIDIEGQGPNNIEEVGIVKIDYDGMKYFYHSLIKTARTRSQTASHCSCIDPNNKMFPKYEKHIVQVEMNVFFFHPEDEDINRYIIHGHGDDVTKERLQASFPEINWNIFEFESMYLSPWLARKNEEHHANAKRLKDAGIICNAHTLKYCPSYNRSGYLSPSNKVKLEYGYHCALIDAIELAMYFEVITYDEIKACF